jgi:hypothetical protein
VEGFKAGVLYVLGRHDLSRCNTHGRSFETLVSGIGSGYSVSVDAPNGVVYWSDYNGTGVFGATLQVIGVVFWSHFLKKRDAQGEIEKREDTAFNRQALSSLFACLFAASS